MKDIYIVEKNKFETKILLFFQAIKFAIKDSSTCN